MYNQITIYCFFHGNEVATKVISAINLNESTRMTATTSFWRNIWDYLLAFRDHFCINQRNRSRIKNWLETGDERIESELLFILKFLGILF